MVLYIKSEPVNIASIYTNLIRISSVKPLRILHIRLPFCFRLNIDSRPSSRREKGTRSVQTERKDRDTDQSRLTKNSNNGYHKIRYLQRLKHENDGDSEDENDGKRTAKRR